MKKSIKRIGAILLIIAMLLGTMTAMAGQQYSDLTPAHWCYEKIMQFVEKGYINGYEDGTMRPDRTITRAEYVKVVNNFFGYKDGETSKKFSDVSDDAWYADYVYTAVAKGYISGYEDNTFRPNNPITRQEATVILARILGIDDEEYPADHVDGLAQYSDGKEVASWAYTPIHSYSVYNFINGYEDGTLRILQNVTRAETVELLNILEQKIEIDREPEGGGGTSVKKTLPPKVTAYELSGDGVTEISVNGWVNDKSKIQNGSKVVISGENDDKTTLYYKLNDGETLEYNGEFYVEEGKTTIVAWAKRTTRTNSLKIKLDVEVDTVYPEVAGITDSDEKKVKILVEDVDEHNVGYISGINEESLEYAWFVLKDGKYIRETLWNEFENGESVNAPTMPGIYYLGVKGEDNAENKIGEKGKYGIFSNVDKYENVSGDEPTNDPYVIVTENETEGREPSVTPTPNPSEIPGITTTPTPTPTPEPETTPDEVTPSDKPVVVEVEADVKIIHIYDEDRENDIVYDSVVPGKEYTAEVCEEAVNYDVISNDDARTIVVSRDSGDNVIEVIYNRKMVPVKYFFENIENSNFTEDKDKKGAVKVPANMIVDATIKNFPGFTFDSGNKENVVSGDVSVSGDLELKLYYKRILYTVIWKDYDETILETDENVKFGAEPEYNGTGTLKRDRKPVEDNPEQYVYKFNYKWAPNLEVVSKDITYTAVYDKVLRGTIDAEIKCEYTKPDSGSQPEPGTILTYTISLAENGQYIYYPSTIEVKLDNIIMTGNPTIITENTNVTYSKDDNKFIWKIDSSGDLKKELKYKITVQNDVTPNTLIDTSISGTTREVTHNIKVENTVAVRKNVDKHIVLALDASGTMLYRLDENQVANDSEDSRLDVMKRAANAFVNNVLTEKGTEIIDITLIIFGSGIETKTYEGETYSNVSGDINNIGAQLTNTTNMAGAVSSATQVFKNVDDMTKIFVFISDGEPWHENSWEFISGDIQTEFNNLDVNSFAIGIGNNYSRTEFLKVVDESKIFSADNETELNDAFNTIAYKMDEIQSIDGKITVEAEGTVDEIIIGYINKKNETVGITISSTEETQLKEYNITIGDNNQVTWDISGNKYSGCKDFVIKVKVK